MRADVAASLSRAHNRGVRLPNGHESARFLHARVFATLVRFQRLGSPSSTAARGGTWLLECDAAVPAFISASEIERMIVAQTLHFEKFAASS